MVEFRTTRPAANRFSYLCTAPGKHLRLERNWHILAEQITSTFTKISLMVIGQAPNKLVLPSDVVYVSPANQDWFHVNGGTSLKRFLGLFDHARLQFAQRALSTRATSDTRVWVCCNQLI
jgi:hypothetical protein